MKQDFNILLIDDNVDHIKIITWALEQAEVHSKVIVLRDGDEAIDYLTSIVNSETLPEKIPDLVLLDINLPRVNGFDVLRMIKKHRLLNVIPVVILSSSEREEDVQIAYSLGANTFISKAEIFNEIGRTMNAICSYWADIAKLPNKQIEI